MGEESEIIWGTHIDPSLGEKIQVTTILSGVSSPYDLNFDIKDEFNIVRIDSVKNNFCNNQDDIKKVRNMMSAAEHKLKMPPFFNVREISKI